MLFADFPNSKFWFPEFVSSYAWHVTEIGGSSGIEIIFAPNKFEILKNFYCLLFYYLKPAESEYVIQT